MDASDKDSLQNSSATLCNATLFEKSTEKSSTFLNNIWANRTFNEIEENDNDDDEILSNNLEETEFFQNRKHDTDQFQAQNNTASETNYAQPSFDSNQVSIGQEDSHSLHDSSKDGGEFTDDESDATDYFDSDDEYQLSCNRRLMMEADSDFVYGRYNHYSTSHKDGRYSQGVEQYMNMPVFMRSIRKFATDNEFEIWNGKTDGSCMFRSLADQLALNGHFGHTADTLRLMAVEYLREHPLQEDGCPIESFLSTETWVEYLTRMSNPTEWSDHIMLKAVVDALHLEAVVFNIYKDDVRRTEVKSSRNDIPFPALTIYLGHLGEFHYVSLRPKKWEKLWPYRALLHRTIFFANKNSSKRISEKTFERFKNIGIKGNIRDTGLQELFTSLSLKTKCLDQRDEKAKENPERGIHFENSYISMFNSYGLDDLRSEDTNDSLELLIEDPLYVDALTGIPLPHLEFIIKHTIPKELIIEYSKIGGSIQIGNQWFYYTGTFATGDNVAIKDLSPERKIFSFQCKFVRRDPSVVAVHLGMDIQFETISPGRGNSETVLHADCSTAHPGYCWLRPSEFQTSFATKRVAELNDGLFLTKQELPVGITLPPCTRQCFFGFACETFPSVAKEWVQRKRKFGWPSQYVIAKILLPETCTLIQKCHPSSVHPDIEWKLDFSLANSFLFLEALDNFQIYGYHVVKIMIQEATKVLSKRLKSKHILSVFLYACEEIPQQTWETNLAGCILYTLSLLIIYLKRKYFPHYFVSSNNLIDHYTDDEIETICLYIEAIRLFPNMVISFAAERHGYIFSGNLSKRVLSECRVLSVSRDLSEVYRKTFLPATFRVSKFFCRLGFYSLAFRIIREAYEETLGLPSNEEGTELGRQSFLEFFIEGLRGFKQKSSSGILRQLFDLNNKTEVFTRCSNKRLIISSELIPWKVDFRLAWIRVPKEKTRDFSSLASFFYDMSLSQYKMENVSLASLGIDTAIRFLCRAISNVSFNTEEVEDSELRKEIIEQQETTKKNLKSRLFHFYIHAYHISFMDARIYPIATYMSAIETLSEEFPEMYEVVAEMFYFIRKDDKGREYQRKFDDYISERKFGLLMNFSD